MSMINLGLPDIIVIALFFAGVMIAGFIGVVGKKSTLDDYLLSGRNLGLILFIMTNVSTWYGGILGVGEFTYRYGIMNWFTQGLPYYIFAVIFAFLLAGKIRISSLFTIPDKIEEVYGRKASIITAIIVFILVTPAPYILMIGTLLKMIFGIDLLWGMLIGFVFTIPYLFKGGFKSDIFTDAFEFVIMFAGFAVIIFASFRHIGNTQFLIENLPDSHLTFTGGASPAYVAVWFFIALWTFVDPGFHQRCYAAKNPETAKKGILISVIIWLIFDLMTTLTGLYAKIRLPDLASPVMAYPALAESILSPGLKGLFYAGMLATIFSTLNSFVFMSAGTFSRDFSFRLFRSVGEKQIRKYTYIGIIISAALSVALAFYFPSVVNLWYLIGSICIPGLIMPVISAYYEKLQIKPASIILEMTSGIAVSLTWYILRKIFTGNYILDIIEPMIAGLVIAVIIHIISLVGKNNNKTMEETT